MRLTLTGLLLAVLGASCGDSPPEFTLQQVMNEIDGARKELEKALLGRGGLERARKQAEAIEWWSKDGAFERYLERTNLPSTPAHFDALRSEFDLRLADLLAALRQGKGDEARAAYPRLTATCDDCHATYRPLLLHR